MTNNAADDLPNNIVYFFDKLDSAVALFEEQTQMQEPLPKRP